MANTEQGQSEQPGTQLGFLSPPATSIIMDSRNLD